MKLSVVVPVYNVELYIRRCLDSIINQTYKNLEIILVDDGSTDKSGLICDEYALTDGRIKVIHKENGGIVSARQAGIGCATGEYATNVDSDDWLEREAYEFMVEKLEEYHPDMLIVGYKKEYAGFTEEYRQILEDGFYLREQFWEAFNQCVKSKGFFCQPIDMSLWSKAIKTKLWKKYQMACGDDLRKNVDDAVIFPCLLNIRSIYIGSESLYHYCVRKNSILWNERKDDFKSFVRLSKYFIFSFRNSKNKEKMGWEFLLYKLFYHLILDVPEKMIDMNQCKFYPQIKTNSNIIVYGKGVFANRLIERIRSVEFCNVVDNFDKADLHKIGGIEENEYDFIVIAILNYHIVASTVELLACAGVAKDKILFIEKENLSVDLLPEEVKEIWEEVFDGERV